MNNNNMNYIMEHLENAVTELEKIMQVMLPTEYAVYVDMDQELHYISVQDALSLIDDYGKNCMSEMIGKSDYLLVYDEDRRIVVDGNALEDIKVLTDPGKNMLLIMKDGKIYKNDL